MAFVIDTRGTFTPQSRMGESFSKGFDVGMQGKLTDLLERQKTERALDTYALQNKQLGLNKMLGVKELRAPTENVLQYLKFKTEMESLNKLAQAEIGDPHGTQNFETDLKTQNESSMDDTYWNLPYQKRPALGENEPIPQKPTEIPIAPTPTKTLSLKENINKSNKYWDTQIKNAPAKSVPALITAKKNAQAALRDEAKVAAAEGKNILAREQFEYKQKEDVAELNRKQIDPIIESINQRESKNLELVSQLATAREAVRSGETEGLTQWLAAKGFAPGSTPGGALLKYLSKENIGNIVDRIGGRANMFLERVASTASAQPGHDKPTALALMEFEESEMRKDHKEAEIARSLAQKYADMRKKMIPGQFQYEVNKKLSKWMPKNVQYTSYKIQQVREEQLTDEEMLEQAFDKALAPGYTPLTQRRMAAMIEKKNGDRAAAAKRALELGYTVPTQTIAPK